MMLDKKINGNCSGRLGQLLFAILFFLTAACISPRVYAHQTPTTIALLDVSPGKVGMELQLPLTELELAFGHEITKNPESVIDRLGPQLAEYLKAHIHPYTTKEYPWAVEVLDMQMDKGLQPASGPPYWEVIVHLLLKPQHGEETRTFMLDYDVIMHQVMNHAAFVSIRNDWERGRTVEQTTEAGVIRWDMKDNVIYPFEINLEKGSWWKGFRSMVGLGLQHISEGTDHLLFLLVLLLPAMLVVNGKKWGGFGGTNYSLLRLLKIVTAFTIGHSITLLIGALGWVRLPTQPVEILIAFSILVSAVHAIKPIFPGKETYVACGFGLVHGLAFASTIANLNLSAGAMALSILGFNIGIELMQLFVIAVTAPWLLILSRSWLYQYVRIGGAIFAGIAAIGWMVQRYVNSGNILASAVEYMSRYAVWLVVALAIVAIASNLITRDKPIEAS